MLNQGPLPQSMPKAHVVGLGKSGVAAARLLKRDGWEVELGDRNTSPDLLRQQQELAVEQITVKLGYSLELQDSDLPQLIVVSPGVPWDIPVLVKAREMEIETIGEMELAWRHLQTIPWVGITGTNGKTTTTSLITAIFQAAGLNAPACGNIGYAACEVALSFERGGKGERERGEESPIQNPKSKIQNPKSKCLNIQNPSPNLLTNSNACRELGTRARKGWRFLFFGDPNRKSKILSKRCARSRKKSFSARSATI